MRYCTDIGMFAVDRPRSSCVHRSPYCEKHCYNNRVYSMYPETRGCEPRLAAEWETLNPIDIAGRLGRANKRQTSRVRLMTRGEAFASLADVPKVQDICLANPDTLFWVPTRAWRHPLLRGLVRALALTTPNARVLASVDPSTTDVEWALLEREGWSTMFFGDNDRTKTPLGTPLTRCAKTFGHVKGACATCTEGCFSATPNHAVHVILQEH